MTVSHHKPEGLARRFQKQVVLPLVFLLAFAIAAAAFSLYWATRSADTVARQREELIIRSTVSSSLQDLASQQRSAAEWPPLLRALERPADNRQWLNENIGGWLHEMFAHQRVYVLDAHGAPLYASVDGHGVAPAAFDAVRADLRALIDAALVDRRVETPDGRPVLRPRPVSADADAAPVAAGQRVKLIRLDGRPAAAGAIHIGPPDPRDPVRYVLVTARFLDGAYLEDLARRSGLGALRFEAAAPARAERASVPLDTWSGAPTGSLTWSPDTPGRRMIDQMLPFAVGGLATILLAVGLLTRRLWHTSSSLAHAMLELRASEAQAQHLAFHDVLTGLPNRARFEQRLEEALIQVRLGAPIVLFMIDLDRFKEVNDTLGHAAGDALIRTAAHRISELVPQGDAIARLGGDEFAVIHRLAPAAVDADDLAQAILMTLQQPFTLFGSETFISASIGMARAPEHASDRSDLLRKADIALYAAKKAGRNQWRYFVQSMDETTQRKQTIAADLRSALAGADGLSVHYQPQVNTEAEIVGLEALARWRHPTRGNIGPDEFIPIAEEAGLIGALGEFVLRHACRAARRWPHLSMAVNLSPAQFRLPDFARRLTDIVREEGCTPGQIEWEITEGILLEDDETSRGAIEALRAHGFKVALDDFGTGYSSLNYLRRIKVDKIKIDRSFIQPLDGDSEAAAIVESVVRLGHAMNLTVTAEGVETDEQRAALIEAGCNELQGFYFFRPLPLERLEGVIAASTAEPAVGDQAA